MEFTEMMIFKTNTTEIVLRECFSPSGIRSDRKDKTDYTIFVKDKSVDGLVMFTFNESEDAEKLFRAMMKADIS